VIDGTIIGLSGTNFGELSQGNFSPQVGYKGQHVGLNPLKAGQKPRLSSIGRRITG
jgi:hypothetical protein